MAPDTKGALLALAILLIVFALGAVFGFTVDHVNIDWN